MGFIGPSTLIMSFPKRIMRAHPPPTVSQPFPLSSMTTPGSKAALHSPAMPGVFVSTKL